MHNPESVLENRTHQLLWDFEIQTGHQIFARRLDLIIIIIIIIIKRTCRNVEFVAPVDHQVRLKGNEKTDKYKDLVRELKKYRKLM